MLAQQYGCILFLRRITKRSVHFTLINMAPFCRVKTGSRSSGSAGVLFTLVKYSPNIRRSVTTFLKRQFVKGLAVKRPVDVRSCMFWAE